MQMSNQEKKYTDSELLNQYYQAISSVGKSTYSIDVFTRSLSADQGKRLSEIIPKEMDDTAIEKRLRKQLNLPAKD